MRSADRGSEGVADAVGERQSHRATDENAHHSPVAVVPVPVVAGASAEAFPPTAAAADEVEVW